MRSATVRPPAARAPAPTVPGARARSGVASRARQAGFSLVEVLIAMLVMGFGLLGLAMMQTLSVRYAQSSNYRTQATHLAYDLFDQIRANRALASQFLAIDRASFGAETGRQCSRPLAYVGPAASAARWKCQVRAALGPGAYAVVAQEGARWSVTVSWSDARGAIGAVGGDYNGRVVVRSQL